MYAHDEFGSWKGGVKVPFTTSTYLAPGEGSVQEFKCAFL